MSPLQRYSSDQAPIVLFSFTLRDNPAVTRLSSVKPLTVFIEQPSYKLLRIKTVDSVILGRTVEAEPITSVVGKVVMQDMEETGSGMVKAVPEILENGLIR